MEYKHLHILGEKVYYMSMPSDTSIESISEVVTEIIDLTKTDLPGKYIVCYDARYVQKMPITSLGQLLGVGVKESLQNLYALVQIGGENQHLIGFVGHKLSEQLGINYKMVTDTDDCYRYLSEILKMNGNKIGSKSKSEFRVKILNIQQ